MQLWTVFGFASNTAHKNQCVKRIVRCSYHQQPIQKPAWAFAYETVPTSIGCVVQTAPPHTHTQRLPDLTLCDFFLWRYIRDKVLVLPLLKSMPQLRQQITTAIASITKDNQHKIWNKLDYHFNIYHVTPRAHTESLWGVYETSRAAKVSGNALQIKRIQNDSDQLCRVKQLQLDWLHDTYS